MQDEKKNAKNRQIERVESFFIREMMTLRRISGKRFLSGFFLTQTTDLLIYLQHLALVEFIF